VPDPSPVPTHRQSLCAGHRRHESRPGPGINRLPQPRARLLRCPAAPAAVTMRRFRRTVAWFINRQPGGRIALGVQYGHLRASFGESHSGRSKVDMLEILDLEQALATADTLTHAAERLNDGEGGQRPCRRSLHRRRPRVPGRRPLV
jgi:hypothetical protein